MASIHGRTWEDHNVARHYSSKDLFRQMPNALLARYFNARGLLPDLDFGAMPPKFDTSTLRQRPAFNPDKHLGSR